MNILHRWLVFTSTTTNGLQCPMPSGRRGSTICGEHWFIDHIVFRCQLKLASGLTAHPLLKIQPLAQNPIHPFTRHLPLPFLPRFLPSSIISLQSATTGISSRTLDLCQVVYGSRTLYIVVCSRFKNGLKLSRSRSALAWNFCVWWGLYWMTKRWTV